jgi:hypothetical protein
VHLRRARNRERHSDGDMQLIAEGRPLAARTRSSGGGHGVAVRLSALAAVILAASACKTDVGHLTSTTSTRPPATSSAKTTLPQQRHAVVALDQQRAHGAGSARSPSPVSPISRDCVRSCIEGTPRATASSCGIPAALGSDFPTQTPHSACFSPRRSGTTTWFFSSNPGREPHPVNRACARHSRVHRGLTVNSISCEALTAIYEQYFRSQRDAPVCVFKASTCSRSEQRGRWRLLHNRAGRV